MYTYFPGLGPRWSATIYYCYTARSSWLLASHCWSAAREKTAFVTHNGLYKVKDMLFGLHNAPAMFQHLTEVIRAA